MESVSSYLATTCHDYTSSQNASTLEATTLSRQIQTLGFSLLGFLALGSFEAFFSGSHHPAASKEVISPEGMAPVPWPKYGTGQASRIVWINMS